MFIVDNDKQFYTNVDNIECIAIFTLVNSDGNVINTMATFAGSTLINYTSDTAPDGYDNLVNLANGTIAAISKNNSNEYLKLEIDHNEFNHEFISRLFSNIKSKIPSYLTIYVKYSNILNVVRIKDEQDNVIVILKTQHIGIDNELKMFVNQIRIPMPIWLNVNNIREVKIFDKGGEIK